MGADDSISQLSLKNEEFDANGNHSKFITFELTKY